MNKAEILGILRLFLFWSLFILTAIRGSTGEAESAENMKQEVIEKATFAGGCFWCMEPVFDKIPGVIRVRSGYTGGEEAAPTYEQVSSGRTGHAEAVEIHFDPSKVSYRALLDIFWRNIDPTTVDRQFNDTGPQYRTVVFYHNEEQKSLALASREELEKSGRHGKPVVTEIVPAREFYPAEDYHQNYYQKNPMPYKFYRSASGRDAYLKKIWKGEAARS